MFRRIYKVTYDVTLSLFNTTADVMCRIGEIMYDKRELAQTVATAVFGTLTIAIFISLYLSAIIMAAMISRFMIVCILFMALYIILYSMYLEYRIRKGENDERKPCGHAGSSGCTDNECNHELWES